MEPTVSAACTLNSGTEYLLESAHSEGSIVHNTLHCRTWCGCMGVRGGARTGAPLH